MSGRVTCAVCGLPARLLDAARCDAQRVLAWFAGRCRHVPPEGAVWVIDHPEHEGRCWLGDVSSCRGVTAAGRPCRRYPGRSGFCAAHAGQEVAR